MGIDYRNTNNSRGGRSAFKFIQLVLSTALYNGFRIYFSLLGLNRKPAKLFQVNKLCILGFGGIGNHLMLVPVIKALKKYNPGVIITVIVPSKACAGIFKNNPDVSSVIIIKQRSRFVFKGIMQAGIRVRRLKPDAVMAASGTNPVTGGLISYWGRAKIRVGEDWHGRGWLYTNSIKANQHSSEINQNFKLARIFNIVKESNLPELYLSEKEIEWGHDWLKDCGLRPESKKIGIHPGCGKSQKWKRWDIENFLKVTRNLTGNGNVEAVYFIGPDDTDLIRYFSISDAGRYVIFPEKYSIREAASVIKICDVFLSNDSGLRHIAAAVGAKTIGIFGPTSIKKNFTTSDEHLSITAECVSCSPCHYTGWWLACGDKIPCLRLVSPEDVTKKVLLLLHST